jgi:heme/copper-type cytochrome/quinol oxidase subunit 4
MKINTISNSRIIVYIILVLFTIVSYILTESENVTRTLALMALPIAGIKFYLIFSEFMEMKKAHKAWKIIMITFLILLLLPIYALI